MEKKTIETIALAILILGGLDLGIIGLFKFNLILALVGGVQFLQSLIYIIIGVAAGYVLYNLIK